MKFDLELMKTAAKAGQWDALKQYAKDALSKNPTPECKKRLDWLLKTMGAIDEGVKNAMGVIADKDRRFRRWFVQ